MKLKLFFLFLFLNLNKAYACRVGLVNDEYLRKVETIILGEMKHDIFIGYEINKESKKQVELKIRKFPCGPHLQDGPILFISTNKLVDLEKRPLTGYMNNYFSTKSEKEISYLFQLLKSLSENAKSSSFIPVWGICEKDSDCQKVRNCNETYYINKIFNQSFGECRDHEISNAGKCVNYYCMK